MPHFLHTAWEAEDLFCFVWIDLTCIKNSGDPLFQALLRVKFRVRDRGLGCEQGVALLQLLSGPEKSPEDSRRECQMGSQRQRGAYVSRLVGASDPP